MKNPIIFLDVDGVLNSMSFLERWIKTTGDNAGMDYRCVRALRKILEASGADIVISSTWRKFFTNEQLGAILEVFGIGKGNVRIIGRTPETFDGGRSHEICVWLNDNNVDRAHGTYLILDDDTSCGRIPELKDRWVQTDIMDTGLRNRHVKQALKILGIKKGKKP